jgi:hypothetical protein
MAESKSPLRYMSLLDPEAFTATKSTKVDFRRFSKGLYLFERIGRGGSRMQLAKAHAPAVSGVRIPLSPRKRLQP